MADPTDNVLEPTAQQDTPRASTRRSTIAYFWIAVRGLCMGAADIVPGVSGGTMAFILGIYEELVESIRAFGRVTFLRSLAQLRFAAAARAVNLPFLVALGCGILAAVLTLAHSIEWLLHDHAAYLWSFFFGLVLASVLVVSGRIKAWSALRVALLVGGSALAYGFVGLVPLQTPETWWFLILSGAAASCALILPGISGAFLLLLLSKYHFVLNAINQRDYGALVLIALGAGLGLIAFTQVLGWLFHRFHDNVIALLTGFMLGSLRKVWPWKEEAEWLRDAAGQFVMKDGQRIAVKENNLLPWDVAHVDTPEILLACGLAVVGFAVVVAIDRLAKRTAMV